MPGFPFLFPFGPVIAAMITASLGDGLAGLRDLLERCLRWRVGLRWYAAAAVAAVVLNVLLGAPAPDLAQFGPWYSIAMLLPLAMIDAPLQENSGWHGYAMPRFPADRSPLANTLIFGVLLAGWHAPLAFAEPSITVPYLLLTVLSQVVTNWIYFNAGQSALLAILYHSAANAASVSRLLSGPDLTRYFWLLLAANAVVVVAVVVLDRKTWRSDNTVAQPKAKPVSSLS